MIDCILTRGTTSVIRAEQVCDTVANRRSGVIHAEQVCDTVTNQRRGVIRAEQVCDTVANRRRGVIYTLSRFATPSRTGGGAFRRCVTVRHPSCMEGLGASSESFVRASPAENVP